MIQIYSPANVEYSANGDAILLPDICEAHMDLNGAWSMTLTHPIDEEGRWKEIVEEAVISAPAGQAAVQLFRIKTVDKTDTEVTAKAYPIFFDSADEHFLYDIRPTNASGQQALDAMTSGSKFSGESNIATKSTAYFEDRNMMDCLNGQDEPTFIQRWGGEILYNNFKVIVNDRTGEDNGAEVRYGKNMEHINYHVDMSEVCTRIIPVAYNGRKHSSTYIDSPNINKYAKIYHRKIKFEEIRLITDVSENDDTSGCILCATQEELDAALLEKCQEQYDLGIDLPKVTISVDMIMLSATEEYKEFAEIEKIGLGDTVSCYNRDLDISTKARAIELVWDCIEDCAKNVVLGDYQYNYFSQVNSAIQRIQTAIRPDGSVVAERVKGILDAMETSLRLQSSAARKVEGRAFLIEDLDPESPLFGAMEAGTQGLRIADEKDEEGNWIWKTAITASGGTMAALITGLISDRSGSNYWDLDGGKIGMNNGAIHLKGQKVFNAADYTEADKTTCRAIIDGEIELTNEYLEKYDIDCNGAITALDYVRVSNMVSGASTGYTVDTSIEINSGSADGTMIRTQGVSVRPNGLWAKNLSCDNLSVKNPSYEEVTLNLADTTNFSEMTYACRYYPLLGMVFARIRLKANALTANSTYSSVVSVVEEKYKPAAYTALASQGMTKMVSARVQSGSMGLVLRTHEAVSAGNYIYLSGFWDVQ